MLTCVSPVSSLTQLWGRLSATADFQNGAALRAVSHQPAPTAAGCHGGILWDQQGWRTHLPLLSAASRARRVQRVVGRAGRGPGRSDPGAAEGEAAGWGKTPVRRAAGLALTHRP